MTASGNRRFESRRAAVGHVLDRTGRLCLPLGIGLFAGYWIADFGVPWLPDTLRGLAAFFLGALLLMFLGQGLKGNVVRDDAEGLALRKRAIVLLTLSLVAAMVRLAVYWSEQPAPLTRLSTTELEDGFLLDSEQYFQLDAELEGLLETLEGAGLSHGDGEGRGAVGEEVQRALSVEEELLLRQIWAAFHDSAFALEQVRIFYEDWYRFDPSRAERAHLLRSYLLTFAAELALYEKGVRLTRVVDRLPAAKVFLDAPHPELGMPEHSFSVLRQELLGARDQGRVVAGEHYLAWLDDVVKARELASTLGFGELRRAIDRDLAVLEGVGFFERGEETLRADLQVVKRAVRRTWFPAQKGVAEWIGTIKTRRPGRYLITREQLDEARQFMRPGDVLLGRKNWHLSNVALPGFWPHAMLYLGTPEELASAFDLPEVRASMAAWNDGEEISLPDLLRRRYPAAWAGYVVGRGGEPLTVLEALGKGVLLNTMTESAGDSLAALRPRLSASAKAEAILFAFGQLGKPYDFDFDFSTDHALVCTELVWRSYRPRGDDEGFDPALVEVAGRLTLPANELARIYSEQVDDEARDFDFVVFIDALEREERSFFSDEVRFRETHLRPKWDVMQE